MKTQVCIVLLRAT